MKEFEKVIGYKEIKEELYKYLEIMRNPSAFERVGAVPPKVICLNGDPGLGKTLLAECFIAASKRNSYIVHPKKDVTNEYLENVFKEAKQNQPSIILLDDFDKLSNSDDDMGVFNLLQGLLDEYRKEDIFIIMTANELSVKMPPSLLRKGRCDKIINIADPEGEDRDALVSYYLKNKPIDSSVDCGDIAAMVSHCSCAHIESLLNKAAINAGYRGGESISIEDIIFAKENIQDFEYDGDENIEVIYHEAGHALIGLICTNDPNAIGFVSTLKKRLCYCKFNNEPNRRPHCILISLAGKAAAEMKFGKVASGCDSDIDKAVNYLYAGYSSNGIGGFSLVPIDDRSIIEKNEAKTAVAAKLQEYLYKAYEIIANNRELLEAMVEVLKEKGYMLKSDIVRLVEEHPLNREAIVGI